MALPDSLTVSRVVVSSFALIIQTIPYFQGSVLKARGCKSSSKVWTAAEDKMLQQTKLENNKLKGLSQYSILILLSSNLSHGLWVCLHVRWHFYTAKHHRAVCHGKERKNQIDSSKHSCFKQSSKEEKLILFSCFPPPPPSQQCSAYLFDSSLLFDAFL